MKTLSWIARMLTGSLFIVSGLIKANDPLGFAYKLEEYFTVFGMPWLHGSALFFAAFVCILEIILGVAVLYGTRMVTVSWLLLMMIVFFTFLTFYSAYFNKVTDCGCFGDALKLTPWESFTKDIVLLVLTLLIFFDRKKITHGDFRTDVINTVVAMALIILFSLYVINWMFPVYFSLGLLGATIILKYFYHSIPNTIVLGLSGVLSAWFTWHCLNHLPIKDFRPYAIGKNITEGMSVPDDAPQDSVVMVFQYKKGGQMFEFSAESLPEDLDSFEFVDRLDRVVRKGYIPPIKDFKISDASGADRTNEFLLHDGYVLMVVAYDLKKSNVKVQSKINALAERAHLATVPFFAITSTSPSEAEVFRHEHQNAFDYYHCDGTPLKTIIRSNPGLVLMRRGTVVDMWHYNDFPTFDEVKKRYPWL